MMLEEELLNSKMFLEDFSDKTEAEVFKEFQNYEWQEPETRTTKPDHIQIIFAYYLYECYEGSAYVLGYDHEAKKFFEIYGSHCSCYGLEDQWDPEYFDNYDQFILNWRAKIKTQPNYLTHIQDTVIEFLRMDKGE